jgi:hypothetical protein
LSEAVQVQDGILNQLTDSALTDIVGRLSDALLKMGADFNQDSVMKRLTKHLTDR